MRLIPFIAAALIWQASPSDAQTTEVFTLEQALGIALEIGQSWPDDIITLRDTLAGERAITWSGFAGIPGLPSAAGPSDDP